MSKVQTDNSFLDDKIALRFNHLSKNKKLLVLDCYAGNSLIWHEIINKYKDIEYLPIDKKNNKQIQLKGDNVKFLNGLNLNKFNIIDLDTYGVPYKALNIIFTKQWHGTLFITFNRTIMGCLPRKMLNALGYTNTMINKIPTLFYRNGFNKFKNWLSLNHISKIHYRQFKDRKYYIACKI